MLVQEKKAVQYSHPDIRSVLFEQLRMGTTASAVISIGLQSISMALTCSMYCKTPAAAGEVTMELIVHSSCLLCMAFTGEEVLF
jgi:hypothetical protein